MEKPCLECGSPMERFRCFDGQTGEELTVWQCQCGHEQIEEARPWASTRCCG
jgi:hypothetical protein